MENENIELLKTLVAPVKEFMAKHPRCRVTIDAKGAVLEVVELQETLDSDWKHARAARGIVNDA